MCMHTYVCVYMCTCVCVYMRMCVCVLDRCMEFFKVAWLIDGHVENWTTSVYKACRDSKLT